MTLITHQQIKDIVGEFVGAIPKTRSRGIPCGCPITRQESHKTSLYSRDNLRIGNMRASREFTNSILTT